MEIDLLDFVEQCRDLSKQALGKYAGEPASGGFVRWIHVVLHCFRLEEGYSYRETPNRLKYLTEICDVLGLDREKLPDYSTVYKPFDRLKMSVWRALLRVSAQQHPQSGHATFSTAQRWMAETSYSTTKRSLGDAVRAFCWYLQFREIVLMFAIVNIKSLCEPF